MMPRVLVTGAGGFVGGWMAEAFHLQGWAEVRAGISRWSSAARIARFPIEIVECDVMNETSMMAALEGCDYVVHCARGRGDDNTVTVEGTRLLLRCAEAQGVKKLIYMSSVAVYGAAVGAIDEDTRPVLPITQYGQGKREAEEICRAAAHPGFCIAAIRPTLIYGPFSEQWTIPYIQRLVSGRWRALGRAGEGRCNLVYVGDLVRLARFLIDSDFGSYDVFNANGPEIPTWNSYLERLNAELDLPPLAPPDRALGLRVAMRVPVRKLGKYLLANHKSLVSAVAQRSPQLKSAMLKTEADLRLMPNADEIERFATEVTYSNARAAGLGFAPTTSVDRGIALTVDWARQLRFVT
ncbi:putative UDP-N-acetylglucosamine 4-epimerase [Bradyrhizobium sp. ORS 375]|uniref:NAD-dependent epimerase/dehydratase family protein n=1 Tax=Bradyrhizobium sp. (strain ORS 375) TaxID=566679 RepID=UPI0002405990|nr:NAD(P)-dependent oxidoreductase [Bradyrhizobium sp. ORS 375]CCD95838.1 putative UDP-N-acetylglucosamine 4-epimerase [Bradyrhizobium sp. ORS 375]